MRCLTGAGRRGLAWGGRRGALRGCGFGLLLGDSRRAFVEVSSVCVSSGGNSPTSMEPVDAERTLERITDFSCSLLSSW